MKMDDSLFDELIANLEKALEWIKKRRQERT